MKGKKKALNGVKISGNKGQKCELCERKFDKVLKRVIFYFNYDPSCKDPRNLIYLCPSCGHHWSTCNPKKITTKNGLFNFAINRGFYGEELRLSFEQGKEKK